MMHSRQICTIAVILLIDMTLSGCVPPHQGVNGFPSSQPVIPIACSVNDDCKQAQCNNNDRPYCDKRGFARCVSHQCFCNYGCM